MDDIVAQQVACGIDVVSDGEMSKPSYTMYVRHRVKGIEMSQAAAEKGRHIMVNLDAIDHPDFGRGSVATGRRFRSRAASGRSAMPTRRRSSATSRI